MERIVFKLREGEVTVTFKDGRIARRRGHPVPDTPKEARSQSCSHGGRGFGCRKN